MLSSVVLHFQTVDPILSRLIKIHPPHSLPKSENPFFSLIESIISQQLSVKAGDTIMNRFLTLIPENSITPEVVLSLSKEQLRATGMSWNKAEYIQNIARKVLDDDFDFTHLDRLSDEELIVKLTTVKGVGRWTAEMFLMFSLGREDVFSTGDVGLQRAIQKLYSLKKKPTEHQLLKISHKWKPYRTYACRILWKSLDEK